MITVGLVYNLKPASLHDGDAFLEWDEAPTIKAIEKALSVENKVVLIDADKSLPDKLARNKKDIDIIFNIAEGENGPWREAIVPVLAEELGIPYTGSGPATMVLSLDKKRTKDVLAYHGVRYPFFKVFEEIPELTSTDISPLGFPLIVKPLWEGSSKGINNNSLVININNCQHEVARVIQTYKQPALVEEFIPGREFTVGVLGNDDPLIVLPIVELNFSSLPPGANHIYSYEAKWVWDVPEKPLDMFFCPARVTQTLENKIKETAKKAYRALGCRDWCRIDIRLDNEENPYILELNPIPGILPDPSSNSCLPKAAYTLGWNYEKLLNSVLGLACKRYGLDIGQKVCGHKGH